MTRNEFDESPDAMVIVVRFDHNTNMTNATAFSGEGDVCARAMSYKKKMLEIHSDWSVECITDIN